VYRKVEHPQLKLRNVITTSGYRIGPFDVESALLEHDAVIEAAVIGVHVQKAVFLQID
jgi:acyl-coenzyme A synthetase/AMP-(fatty) acid ligase